MIIGLGSGRCGTASLATLLNEQVNAEVTHEGCPLPWDFDSEIWKFISNNLFSRKADVVGDVGYYWINYVERLLDVKPDTKFICLKRDRQETMDSYMVKSSGLNVHPTDDWFRLFPRYNLSPKEAVGAMWDDYYKIAESWQKKYPDKFVLMDMDDALNDEDNQRKMLNFVGFSNPQIRLNIRLNANV